MVGLKSMPKPCAFAQATHGSKCLYYSESRSTQGFSSVNTA